MLRRFKSLAAVAAVGLVAGCGGSGSPLVSAPKTTQPAGGGSSSSASKVKGTMSIVVRSRKSAKRFALGNRKPKYVSPATSGIFASFADSEGDPATYQGYTLGAGVTATAASPATCGALAADNSYTCTLFFALAPDANGPYAIALTAYDSSQSGTGSTPAAGNALSTDTEEQTVSANQSNTFDFTLQGIVDGFNVTPQYIGVGSSAVGTTTPFSSTFTALDADFYEIDSVDTATAFASGAQSAGPFTENTTGFTVGTIDVGNCTSAAPCTSSSAPPITSPASEPVAFAYNGLGQPGDGSTVMPYHGVVTVAEPTGYATGGFTSATISDTPYAGTAYVVPLFAIVDSTSPYYSSASTVAAPAVSFTASGQTITAYAAQYAPPTGATGYSVDDSQCSEPGYASASALSANPANPGFGDTFTITSGANVGGPCTITISDGGGDTATITVDNASTASTIVVPSPGPVYSPNAKKRK